MTRHTTITTAACLICAMVLAAHAAATPAAPPSPAGPDAPLIGQAEKSGTAVGDHDNVALVTRLPEGRCEAAAVRGDTLYHGDGGYLVMTDVGEPGAPAELGRVVLPSYTKEIVIDGTLAYVANASAGLRIVDATDPATAFEAGALDFGATVLDVDVGGGHAYVAASTAGLRVVDVSVPTAPVEVGSHGTDISVTDIALAGAIAYVIDVPRGLRILDVSTPAQPVQLSYYDPGFGISDVDAAADHVYLACGTEGLLVVDVTAPEEPLTAAVFTDLPDVYRVLVDGDTAYVMDNALGLAILDVSDPSSPALVQTSFEPILADDIAVAGGHAFLPTYRTLSIVDLEATDMPVVAIIAAGTGTTSLAVRADLAYTCGVDLRVLDLALPHLPVRLGDCDAALPSHFVQDVEVQGDYAYLAAYADGLRMIDIGDPAAPALLFETPGTGYATGLAFVEPDYLYVTTLDAGLRIFQVTPPTAMVEVGHFASVGAMNDVAVAGGHAYVSDDAYGLRVLDVSNPTMPVEVLAAAATYPGGIHIEDGIAYVADAADGLRVYDLSDVPSSITPLGQHPTTGPANDVALLGDYACVSTGHAGLEVVDVSDPTGPCRHGHYATGHQAVDVAIADDHVYVADTYDGIWVFTVDDATGARTWHVPAEMPTIQAGLDAACAGDTVLVACGIYYEHNIQMKSGVLLRSEVGTGNCATIDAGGLGRIIRCADTGEGTAIEGFILTGGHTGFFENGAGLDVRGAGASLAIRECVFWGNDDEGWSLLYFRFATVSISNSAIVGNAMNSMIESVESDVAMSHCLVAANQGYYVLGNVGNAGLPNTIQVSNCTFADNATAPGVGMFDCMDPADTVAIEHTIIAFNPTGHSIRCDGATVDLVCCDVYGNANGDYVDCFAGLEGVDGNISADPLFCDPAVLDYTISEHSMCAPAQSACGLIGGYGPACSITAVEDPAAATPRAFWVGPAAPNPFNPVTEIAYEIPTAARVTVTVHDVRGRVVRTLHDGEQAPGTYTARWDGTDAEGARAASGVYLCRIDWNGKTESRRIVLMK